MPSPDESLLDRLEMRLGAGLREDAARVRRMEATARILLALPADQGLSMADLARRIARDPSTVTRFAAPTIDFDLLLKNPVLLMSCASTSGRTAAKSCGVGYFLNRPGVTSLTRLSVHCAERIVATSSSHGFV